MPLAVKDGELIAISGELGTSCACCDEVDPDPDGPPSYIWVYKWQYECDPVGWFGPTLEQIFGCDEIPDGQAGNYLYDSNHGCQAWYYSTCQQSEPSTASLPQDGDIQPVLESIGYSFPDLTTQCCGSYEDKVQPVFYATLSESCDPSDVWEWDRVEFVQCQEQSPGNIDGPSEINPCEFRVFGDCVDEEDPALDFPTPEPPQRTKAWCCDLGTDDCTPYAEYTTGSRYSFSNENWVYFTFTGSKNLILDSGMTYFQDGWSDGGIVVTGGGTYSCSDGGVVVQRMRCQGGNWFTDGEQVFHALDANIFSEGENVLWTIPLDSISDPTRYGYRIMCDDYCVGRSIECWWWDGEFFGCFSGGSQTCAGLNPGEAWYPETADKLRFYTQ